MSEYDLYIFFLCGTVFLLLVLLAAYLLASLSHSRLKLIYHGLEDEKLKKEYDALKLNRKNRILDIISKIISIIMFVVCLVLVSLSISISFTSKKMVGDIPNLKAVESGSMSFKNENNKYLFENNINNQIQTFDLILLRKLPAEKDIKLYDIVMYEIDDIFVLHRIVGIEEPNTSHADRKFIFQGDAVPNRDAKKVEYEQMRGIYKNEKIPFVGSFICFMQSPAGYLCILLMLIAFIAVPIIERKFSKARYIRLLKIGYIKGNDKRVRDSYGVRKTYIKDNTLNGKSLKEIKIENLKKKQNNNKTK